jgi:uracil phosphoribosyltransferase
LCYLNEPNAIKRASTSDVHFLEHSLVPAKMSLLRVKTTASVQFRSALEQNAILD